MKKKLTLFIVAMLFLFLLIFFGIKREQDAIVFLQLKDVYSIEKPITFSVQNTSFESVYYTISIEGKSGLRWEELCPDLYAKDVRKSMALKPLGEKQIITVAWPINETPKIYLPVKGQYRFILVRYHRGDENKSYKEQIFKSKSFIVN